jgi:drug/metabolite transporter (DMT)-like permease
VFFQAIEARATPAEESLRLSLLKDLVKRPRWLGGTACVVGGWVFQATALMLAPLSLVQPTLAVSIVVLLLIGLAMHDESIGRSDLIGTISILVGVAGIAAISPSHSDSHAEPVTLAIGMSALGLFALAPYLAHQWGMRHASTVAAGAGIAYAWTGFSTAFLADGFSSSKYVVAGIWLAATAGAALVGLVSEMTALQAKPAIRVFPIVLVVQIVMAVLLAPLLAGERWDPSPLNLGLLVASLLATAAGTRILSEARAVTKVVATCEEEMPDDDEGQPRGAEDGEPDRALASSSTKSTSIITVDSS